MYYRLISCALKPCGGPSVIPLRTYCALKSLKRMDPVERALQHFDDFYKDVFHDDWAIIRENLLKPRKYVAVVNNFGDTEDTVRHLSAMGALDIHRLFQMRRHELVEEYYPETAVTNSTNPNDIIMSASSYESDSDKQVIDSKSATVVRPNLSLQDRLRTAQIDHDRQIESLADDDTALHQFVPTTKLVGREDFMTETEHFQYFNTQASETAPIVMESNFEYPEHWRIFVYENTDVDHAVMFPQAKATGVTGVLNYYLMDGASILPVIALNLRPGDTVLDMCAAPGGKSLLALQTLYPSRLVANDASLTRVKRIHSVFGQFLYDYKTKFLQTGAVEVTHSDGRRVLRNNYDKVLVDVPCTTDRLSLMENENNIFSPLRIKDRLKIPELQTSLLVAALRSVKTGGTVVYSTCSLSPVQNDGVVNMALKEVHERSRMKIVVKDLNATLAQTKYVFKIASSDLCKFGCLVLPDSMNNFGPMYISKLVKLK